MKTLAFSVLIPCMSFLIACGGPAEDADFNVDHATQALLAENPDEASSLTQEQNSASEICTAVCGITYCMQYSFQPWFYRFNLNVTTTTLPNGVGPRPPHPLAGQIRATAQINPGQSNVLSDTDRTDFPDTWHQSHSAYASILSQHHSSEDWLSWKAVSSLRPDVPGCNEVSRIRVWGHMSYAQTPIVDQIIID